jgi:hypothetical protein
LRSTIFKWSFFMKKNVLALSITAAVFGLGFAGGAQAVTAPYGATADDLRLSPNGIGHSLLVPYYTAQGSNATLLNLVNTDTMNGKAVKVRFRSASNSDDVYDFQVFLSPGDVWAASISKGTDGRANLSTNDNSCTKPAKSNLGSGFVTARLDTTFTADQKANATREGYVEIFNMADVAPGTALFTATKHVNGVAPCSGAAWTALDTDAANWAGLVPPTTGLMGNYTIINLATAAAYGGNATAVLALNTTTSTAATGNVVYWPQTAQPVAGIAAFTADPLLRGGQVVGASYDLPDMSTPYTTLSNPLVQAGNLSQAIATTSIKNEFLADQTVAAVTDWVFSMPTRRYSVALDYATNTRVYSTLPTAYFTAANTTVVNRQICVTGIAYTAFDREENSPVDPTSVVISPNVPEAPTAFCGEASVLAINNAGKSGVLDASVAVRGVDLAYKEGWINIATPGIANNGLPVLGEAYVRAVAGSSNFGVNWGHRFSRRGL